MAGKALLNRHGSPDINILALREERFVHISDGYLSPSTCAVFGAAMLPVWARCTVSPGHIWKLTGLLINSRQIANAGRKTRVASFFMDGEIRLAGIFLQAAVAY